jgi:hypothetical protein
MSTPEDQLDPDYAPTQGVLSALQQPTQSPEGRAWGDAYLKAHPQGIDTSGEDSLLNDFAASAEDARTTLRQAREKLAAQRMDPSVLGLRVAQSLLAPSKGGVPDQFSKAFGDVADWRQQNQAFQQQQGAGDLNLAQQLNDADKQQLQARLALQKLREQTGSQLLGTALKATAKPAQPTPAPHYSMVQHDVTMPDGSPGKQAYMVDSSSGKVTPYGEPTAGTKAGGLDSRSGALFQRVLSSANEATAAVDNITNLPIGASSGILGIGASPGTSWLSSAKGALTNKLAPQEVQDYMTMLPGLAKNLASIESGGLASAQSLNDVFNKLELREGDTGYTKLHKMAEYRQIVEKGIEPYLSNPKIAPEQKQLIQQMVDQLHSSVPFTHNDVTGLEKAHQQNPDMTFGQYISSQGLSKSKSTTAPSSETPKASSLPPAAISRLQEGFTTTFANGQKWTLHNGQPTQVP